MQKVKKETQKNKEKLTLSIFFLFKPNAVVM